MTDRIRKKETNLDGVGEGERDNVAGRNSASAASRAVVASMRVSRAACVSSSLPGTTTARRVEKAATASLSSAVSVVASIVAMAMRGIEVSRAEMGSCVGAFHRWSEEEEEVAKSVDADAQ
jgi:hypothetical protein